MYHSQQTASLFGTSRAIDNEDALGFATCLLRAHNKNKFDLPVVDEQEGKKSYSDWKDMLSWSVHTHTHTHV